MNNAILKKLKLGKVYNIFTSNNFVFTVKIMEVDIRNNVVIALRRAYEPPDEIMYIAADSITMVQENLHHD